nr:ABC transporter substrate-binding protein [uncultured Roseovarius sp.]
MARAVLVGAMMTGGIAHADPPARVVSMNLCTDQLAMMLAGAGQLLSVSQLASDPHSSAMATEARAYPANQGLAEEIYLMQPDLVLAGTYSKRATVSMLQRLGIPVVLFDPANSLADVRARIKQMGAVLGQPARADAALAAFDQRLAALHEDVQTRPDAALYYANSYTSGNQTLAGHILLAAGFANAADRAGYAAGMKMPLEVLALIAPDLVITGQRYPGASRSEEVLDHPVVATFRQTGATAAITDRDWICGTPHVLNAIKDLGQTRRALEGVRE